MIFKALSPVVLLVVAISAFSGVATAQKNERPNVILILSDDQGWADIGYNNPKVYSPNLDRLAREGVVFTQHYVMPQCTPTRVALLTGRYPGRFGGAALEASNLPAFPQGTPTIASMLKANGYSTYLAGKWHLGSSPQHGPNHFGFDSSYGSLAGAVGMYDHRYRTGEFEHAWHRDHHAIDGAENGTHATDLIAQEAIRVIKQDHQQPYFLFLPFHAVHTPLDERERFVDTPTQVDPDNPKRWLNESEIEWFNDPDKKIQSEPDHEKRLLLAAVHHLDDAIGRIVTALDESGQRDNTLIMFSSDNGPQGNWAGNAYPNDLKLTDFNQPLPFRGKKLDVWEGGIHVPSFVNWRGKFKPRQEATQLHIVDWFPTLASISKSKPLTKVNFDGTDLTDLLLAEKPIPTRTLYWTWNRSTNRWAVRHGKWKTVKYGQGAPKSLAEWQLFNLEDDPAETNNLAAENQVQLRRMHERFLSLRKNDAKQ